MIGRSHHQPHFVVYICTIGNNACVSATQLHVKEKISFIINFIFRAGYQVSISYPLLGTNLLQTVKTIPNPQPPYKLEDGTKGWRKGT